MANLLKDTPPEEFQRPDSVVGRTVCSTSGLIPQPDGSPYVCPTRFEYFTKNTLPTKVDSGVQKMFIDKTTQQIAKKGQTDNVEEKDGVIVTDPTGDSYCVTCPHPEAPTPTP